MHLPLVEVEGNFLRVLVHFASDVFDSFVFIDHSLGVLQQEAFLQGNSVLNFLVVFELVEEVTLAALLLHLQVQLVFHLIVSTQLSEQDLSF